MKVPVIESRNNLGPSLLETRRRNLDLMFLFKLMNDDVDCPALLDLADLRIPSLDSCLASNYPTTWSGRLPQHHSPDLYKGRFITCGFLRFALQSTSLSALYLYGVLYLIRVFINEVISPLLLLILYC